MKKFIRLISGIVLALTLVLVPAQASAQECFQVNIILPEDNLEVNECENFWVNASVAKPPGVSSVSGVQVQIQYNPAVVELVAGDEAPPVFTLNGCRPVMDFWWLFHCIQAGENAEITVTATSPGSVAPGQDSVTIVQLAEPCDSYLRVEMEECPEGVVLPFNTFGIKAEIWNDSDVPVCCASASIEWEGICDPQNPDVCPPCPTGAAELIGVDCANPDGGPCSWDLDCIQPGCYKTVGWTFICTEPGWVKFDITPDGYKDRKWVRGEWQCCEQLEECEITPATCLVHQRMPATCDVELEAVEKVCIDCSESNCFDVTANISEICGDVGLSNLMAVLSVSGNATIEGDKVISQIDVPAGSSANATWTVCCDGPGPVTLSVEVEGNDELGGQVGPCNAQTVVEQKEILVDITSPEDGTKLNVNTLFDLVYTLRSCTQDVYCPFTAGICLDNAPCVELADTEVEILPCTGGPILMDASPVDDTGCWEVTPQACICECEQVQITWHLQCICGTESCELCEGTIESILAYAVVEGDQQEIYRDWDTVEVSQMWKAHISTGMLVVEGVDDDDPNTMPPFQGDKPIEAIPVSDNFTVIVPVINLGQAAAYSVNVTLGFSGNASTDLPLWQLIDYIPCHEAVKLMWPFQCIEEGEAEFYIESIVGYDENTGELIVQDNIDFPMCTVVLDQIPLNVTIIQPSTSEDIEVGETFAIKAKICNESSDPSEVLHGVTATLHWVSLEGCEGIKLADGQLPTINLGDVPPTDCRLQWDEATWQVECVCPGDVEFWVEVEVQDPVMSKDSGVNRIHQWEPGDLRCRILSPVLQPCDSDSFRFGHFDSFGCDLGGPYIATSQDFALAVQLCNTAAYDILVDSYELTNEPCKHKWCDDECDIGDFIEGDPSLQIPWEIPAGECITVTWDMQCVSPGETPINLYVHGYGDLDDECPQCWPVETECCITVQQYSAAHLDVEITGSTSMGVLVSSDFQVTAEITNTGDADAWEAFATLSVQPEGSARVTEGGYTKSLGNLIGHGVNETAVVTWNLHCDEPGESTITVTAGGLDEWGYHTKQRYSDWCKAWILDLEPEAGRPIDPRFIEPDSITVTQYPSVGLDMEITKSVDNDQPPPGATVTYTIFVSNNGPGDATNVYVTESLPAGLTDWVPISATQGVYDPGVGNWDIGDMAAGTSATLVVQATVSAQSGTITNTVTVYADQPDGIPGNNTAEANLDVGGNFDIQLSSGWNLISLPYYIEEGDRSTGEILSDIIDNLDTAWAYEACGGGWKNFSTSGPPGNLAQMRDGYGYWLKMNSPDILKSLGSLMPLPPTSPPTYQVCAGWNLMGYKGITSKKASEYLNGVNYAVIYGFKNGAYKMIRSSDYLEPGCGYWIAVISPGVIYP